jgi:hypothetical protein
MNGHCLHFGTRYPTQSTARGPRSSPARPRPGPGGSRPRRTNSARTTSRPVTRTSRRTGDPPPTPHHVLGTRRTQLSTRTTPSPDAAGPTGASGDSDTNTKERRNKDVWAGRPGMTTPQHMPRAPPGRFRHHRHGMATSEPGSQSPSTSQEEDPGFGQADGAETLQANRPIKLNGYLPAGRDSDPTT